MNPASRVDYAIHADLGGGGIGRIARHALLGLARHGLLARAYASGPPPDGELAASFQALTFPARRWLPFLSPAAHGRWALRSFASRVARALPPACSAFHAWNGGMLAPLRRARALGARITVDRASSHPRVQQRLLVEEYTRLGLRPPQRTAQVEAGAEELALADRILVPSRFAWDSCLAEGLSAERLRWTPFGVDVEAFAPAPLSDGPFTVLFVGQVSLRKGVIYLLRAWDRLAWTGARLRLVGAAHADIEPLLAPYRGRADIEFAGHRGDPREDYRAAHVCVFPSIEEGSALVSYEALAAGRALIVTPHVGAPVDDGVEGYVVPLRDVDAITERLAALRHDPVLLAQLGAAGRERALGLPWTRYGDAVAMALADDGGTGPQPPPPASRYIL